MIEVDIKNSHAECQACGERLPENDAVEIAFGETGRMHRTVVTICPDCRDDLVQLLAVD
jgi:uncharacterized protein with PIN domain